MLVLSRRKNEKIILTTQQGEKIEVVVADIRGDKVRIGINACKETAVHRAEIQDVIDLQQP